MWFAWRPPDCPCEHRQRPGLRSAQHWRTAALRDSLGGGLAASVWPRHFPIAAQSLEHAECSDECRHRWSIGTSHDIYWPTYRRGLATEILDSRPEDLDINTRKFRSAFPYALDIAKRTGSTTKKLYEVCTLLAAELPADVQYSESVNKQLVLQSSRNPSAKLILVDSRVKIKAAAGLLTNVSAKWSDLRGPMEELMMNCVSVATAAMESMGAPGRFSPPAPAEGLPPYCLATFRRLFPKVAHTPERLWAARHALAIAKDVGPIDFGTCIFIARGRRQMPEVGQQVFIPCEKVNNLLRVVSCTVFEPGALTIDLPLSFSCLLDILAGFHAAASSQGAALRVWRCGLRWEHKSCNQASLREPIQDVEQLKDPRTGRRHAQATTTAKSTRNAATDMRAARRGRPAPAAPIADAADNDPEWDEIAADMADLAAGILELEQELDEIIQDDLQLRELVDDGLVDLPSDHRASDRGQDADHALEAPDDDLRPDGVADPAGRARDEADEAPPATPAPPPSAPLSDIVSVWLADAKRGLDLLIARKEALSKGKKPGADGNLSLVFSDDRVIFVKWVEGTGFGREVRLEQRAPDMWFGVWPTASISPVCDYSKADIVHPDIGHGIQRVRACRPKIHESMVLLKRMWETAAVAQSGAMTCLGSCWLCASDAPRAGEPLAQCALCLRQGHAACFPAFPEANMPKPSFSLLDLPVVFATVGGGSSGNESSDDEQHNKRRRTAS